MLSCELIDYPSVESNALFALTLRSWSYRRARIIFMGMFLVASSHFSAPVFTPDGQRNLACRPWKPRATRGIMMRLAHDRFRIFAALATNRPKAVRSEDLSRKTAHPLC